MCDVWERSNVFEGWQVYVFVDENRRHKWHYLGATATNLHDQLATLKNNSRHL